MENHASTHRPSWDEYFLNIMEMIGTRGTCDRGRSGCVIVKDKRIISTGYVGSPIGISHCDEVGHEMSTVTHPDGHQSRHCIRTTHAEQNAICQAARVGTALEGSTLYCKMTPCYACGKMIINAGIARVVALQDYHAGARSKEIFAEAGVQFKVMRNEVTTYSDMKPEEKSLPKEIPAPQPVPEPIIEKVTVTPVVEMRQAVVTLIAPETPITPAMPATPATPAPAAPKPIEPAFKPLSSFNSEIKTEARPATNSGSFTPISQILRAELPL